MKFYTPNSGSVEHYATKYDDCVARATGKPYRLQQGSGRSHVINTFVSDGKRLGDITVEAAKAGFDPNYVVSSIFKHADSTEAAFKIEAPEGQTLADIKAHRKERVVNPEVLAKREAKAAEKAAKLAEREAAKNAVAEAKAAKAAEREAAKTSREADKAKRIADREAAAAAKAAAKATETPAAPKKGKGKAPAAAESETVEA